MATQLLIYERAVPITTQRHGDWSVKTGSDYSFARMTNSVPLMTQEFQSAAAEYVIVFAGSDEVQVPIVILGVRDKENVYVAEEGGWSAKYIPAFIRRYPFVFSSGDDGSTFMLCIDEEFAGCNQEGRGERLFDSEGARTQYLENVLGFLQGFQAQFQRTQDFSNKLKALDLLEPMRAQFTIGSGERLSLTGFTAVSRDRLKQLSGEQLADLAKTDELELIYTHLLSMKNLSPMVERVPAKQSATSEPPEVAGEPALEGDA
jgi:hypothetical protein